MVPRSLIPGSTRTLYMSELTFAEADRKTADMMSSYWANFAATGNSNGKGLPYCPAANTKPEVMELGDRTAPVPLAGNQARVAFFKQYLSR